MSSNSSERLEARFPPPTFPPIHLLVFIALAGYTASVVALLVHEVIGHGLVSLTVGGTFEDFYVSPLEGLAGTTGPDATSWIAIAAGAPTAIVFGLLVWAVVRRRIASPSPRDLATTILLWCIANEAVIDPLLYMTMQPTLGSLVGVGSGDWWSLTREWNVPRLLWLSAGVVMGVPVCALLIQDASRLVSHWAPPSRELSPLSAYWILTLPGSGLQLVYLGVLLPWRDGSLSMALGSALGVPVFGILGALWLRLRKHRPFAPSNVPPAAPRLRTARMSMGLAGFGLAVGFIFGPSPSLRRGVALGPPNPDGYLDAAQVIDLRLDLAGADGPTLRVESLPLPDRGSPFRRRVTRALAAIGPSVLGAEHATRFMAQWNLDGALVRSVSEPRRAGDRWSWSAEIDMPGDSFMVRLWPLTWIRESHIASLRITGGDAADTWSASVGRTPERAVVWTRAPGLTAIDSFVVRAR